MILCQWRPDSKEIKHAKLLEVQAVKVAEGGNLTDARLSQKFPTIHLVTKTEHR